MKRHVTPVKTARAVQLASLRTRAEAELEELGDTHVRRPVMQQLYREAKARLPQQRKSPRLKTGRTRPAGADVQRLLHELQVHELELEMQNAELQGARDRMEVLLEHYTDLYDFAPVGYFTLAADGSIQMANLTGAQLVGLDRSRLVGRSFAGLLTAELRPVFTAFLQRVFAGQTKPSMDLELLHSVQPPRILSMEAQRLPGRQACRAVLADITARRQAEDRVRLSEVRYRRLFEAAHDGVLLIDPVTRRISDANPFMTRLLGCSRDQLAGKELFETGLLKDKAACQEMFRKLKETHEVRCHDLTLETRPGRRQEVELVANLYQENGHAVIQCNIRDITERKRSEEIQRRIEVMAASNRKLEREIVRRRTVESALRQSEQQSRQLLAQSRRMQDQLRRLSRQILSAQEDERRRVSRDLHDVIAQTLAGINVSLGGLRQEAAIGTRGLVRRIVNVQKLVEQSVELVHQFARELRPTVLDDLGLIPALQTFMKSLRKESGLRVSLSAFAAVEKVSDEKRTVLYRVTQEALVNAVRHARASRVDVVIQQRNGDACLRIRDDGQGFSAERSSRAMAGQRLGLLGMRERVEMVGGSFDVTSAPGKGTTVRACIPLVDLPPALAIPHRRARRTKDDSR